MYDLTGFQRDLLYVIAGYDGSPKGLAVKEEIEEYYSEDINHGRLYPNLDTLVERGLVAKGERDKRTNHYSVTERGRREIEARQSWEEEQIAAGEENDDDVVVDEDDGVVGDEFTDEENTSVFGQ